MDSKKPLLIIGASSFAEIAVLYFGRTSEYRVVAVVVEDTFWFEGSVQGIPLIPMSEALYTFDPQTTYFYVATVYTQMNRLRQRLMKTMKCMGFSPASYISPAAYVDESVKLGEHLFIFEDNTIQPFVELKDNVVLWSGNHVGHHSTIGENVFVSSHVVISGHCIVGDNSFLGVNCAVGNNVAIGEFNWIMPGAMILKDTGPGEMWRPQKPSLSESPPPGFVES